MPTLAFRLRTAMCLASLAVPLVLLSSVKSAEPVPDPRQQLKDPSASVRARAALKLAEANDSQAIPILIDLLAELPASEREPVEEFLTALAGEWAPIAQAKSEDRIARAIVRDAWKAWWRNTDGDSLVAVVREHTLTPQMRQNIQQLIRKLGHDDFPTRETAFDELLRLGRVTLPQLREALPSKDLEIARRCRELIERIEREPARALPAAAVRLLALRKPAGAAEALLAYLPFAEEDDRTDEVRKTLAGLAVRDGKLNDALVRALGDESPRLRAAAAEALVQGAGKQGLTAVRPLLKDKVLSVRLQVALASVRDGERAAVPVLIDLLAIASDEQAGRVEELLRQLAGESAPETVWATEEADRKKCRDVWAAWWKNNAQRVDLTRSTAAPSLGFTLICDTNKNRVFEIDRNGKERWAINGVMLPADAVVLPGNRVLIAEYSANRVTERDFKGNILWQKQVNSPVSVQRLANGHTFILSDGQAIREVDRSGKEIYVIQNLPPGVRVAYRSRQGFIVYRTGKGECVRVDTTGKRLRSFATQDVPSDVGTIDLAPDGRILVTQQHGNKLVEYDAGGKKIREVNAPQPSTAMALPNGHYLVASHQAGRVFELDRGGKIVWEQKGVGHAYRARRR